MANSIDKLSGMLVYVQVRDPADCYETEKGKEWKASIVVSEDVADEWNEIYKKQSAKKIKRSDFEKQYKCSPPDGNEKNLYVITLKKNTAIKDKESGELVPIDDKYRPRLKIRQDGKAVDVTDKILAANGSMGHITVYTRNTDYGPIASLQNVLVTKLVEYKTAARNEFDDDDDDTETVGETHEEVKETKEEKKETTKKPVNKPKATQKQVEPNDISDDDDDIDDSDIPF